MTKILFAKTPWSHPILAIGGNIDALKSDIEMEGSDLDNLYEPDVSCIKNEPNGIYLWEGEYLWGDEMGPQVKTRSIRSSSLADISELGLRALAS
jgi:hypothetical protein